MKVLIVVGNYPHQDHPFSGIFNEKCVLALRDFCQCVEVLAPRPYIPSFLASLSPRWKSYGQISRYEVRSGIPVHRPFCPHLPRIGQSFWYDRGAYWFSRHLVRNMHRRTRFDAVMSFDIVLAGGVASRIGRQLGIPVSGWAFGTDMRNSPSSRLGRMVKHTLERLDVVFYQSHELFEIAGKFLDVTSAEALGKQHMVLPHGIPAPPSLPRLESRKRVRSAWGIADDQVLVLNIGRVVREKGMFELLEAVSLTRAQDPRVVCAIIGSKPAYDESHAIQNKLDQNPELRKYIRLLPACRPDEVWDYLCAADIFAFTSHKEGIPNSLLEAMVMEVPSIAFGIPSVLEIEAGRGGLVTVPPFDTTQFAQAILQLVRSPRRADIAARGRAEVMSRFMVRDNMAYALGILAQKSQGRVSPGGVKERQPHHARTS